MYATRFDRMERDDQLRFRNRVYRQQHTCHADLLTPGNKIQHDPAIGLASPLPMEDVRALRYLQLGEYKTRGRGIHMELPGNLIHFRFGRQRDSGTCKRSFSMRVQPEFQAEPAGM